MQAYKSKNGFTLIEIMIVVAIIGLLAAIAIPNLLRARLNANEGSVKANMKAFSTAMESYRTAQNPPSYPPDIATLIDSTPAYLDSSWTGYKHGYYYLLASAADTYAMASSPQVPGTTGNNNFCVDHTGVVKVMGGAFTLSNTGCYASEGTPVS